MTQTPGETLRTYEEIAYIVLTRAIPIAVIVAVLDYAYQWYRTRQQMMMTREEVDQNLSVYKTDLFPKELLSELIQYGEKFKLL